jgi:hypothetical protein
MVPKPGVNPRRTKLKLKYPDCWPWISLARRIPGDLSEDQAHLLFQFARMRTPSVDPVIVELGASRGQASLLLAAGLRSKTRPRMVVFSRWPQVLRRNLQRGRLENFVQTAAGDAGDAVTGWRDPIDLLLVNTSDGAPQPDFARWLPWIKDGGIVLIHGLSAELHLPWLDVRRAGTLAWAVKQGSATPISTGAEHLKTIPPVNRNSANQHAADTTEIAIARLQDFVRRAAGEIAEERHANRALKRSWSWRLAAPLRFAVETLQSLAGLLGSLGASSNIRGFVLWLQFQRQVRESGLFDERYYREKHPAAPWAGANPLQHFFVRGAREGGNPNALFDISYYLGLNPEVAQSGANPLVHYLLTGAYQGLDPSPYFNSSFYLEQNPDVRESGLNPLAHYLAPGIVEGRDPNPWFDTSEYLEQNPDVATFGLNPLVHQLESSANQKLCSQS